jgi:hypothetical protein
MAQFRTNDYSGTLATLARIASLRPEPLPPELVFKAMALHRLGKTIEAEAVAEILRAQAATSSDEEMKRLMTELELVLRAPAASVRKPE